MMSLVASRASRRPRILVVRRRYLGDLILLEPFLRNLREAYADASITVVVDQGYADILRGCESIDCIAEFPTGGSLRARLGAWRAFLADIATERFDLAFDLARNERSAVAVLLSRAQRRVSYEIVDDISHRRRRPIDVWRRRLVTPEQIQATRAEQKTFHTVDWNNRLLEKVGIPTPHRAPRLSVDPRDREHARALLDDRLGPRDPAQPRVVLHIGSRKPSHRWPIERFAAVADWLETNCGCRTVFTAGPEHAELLAQAVSARSVSAPAFIEAPPTLGILYGLLAECDLFVGNDSGPSHMAAAVGTPTCVLFSDSSTAVWRTLGPDDTFLQAPRPCGDACVRPGLCAPGAQRWCVQRITEDEVRSTLEPIVEHLRAPRPNQRPEDDLQAEG